MRPPSSRTTRIAAALGLTLAAILGYAARFPRGDAARIQGSWRVVSVEDDGVVAVDATFLKTRQYSFDGSRAIVRARGGPAATWVGDWVERNLRSPSFRLDPTSNPKSIDLTLPDSSTMRGIYELDGDRLKISFSLPARAAMIRPTGFSVPGSKARIVVLEREGR